MPVDFSLELRLAFLRAAQAAQEEVEDNIALYRQYWDGEQNVELTDRQEEYLREEINSFGNICKRVVNIPKDRLELEDEGIVPADEQSEDYAGAVSDWWKANLLESKQKELYEASLKDGQAALVVGYDTLERRPTFTPNLVYDGATGLVRFHYDSDDNLLFASKRWTIINPLSTDTGSRRMTIYRPDLIERYEADGKQVSGWRFLEPDELGGLPNPQIWTDTGTSAGEPLGIPVIPFENPGGSELVDVINIQELLNHNLATFDISVDLHAFPLLWLVNADLPIDSTTGKALMPDFGPGQAVLLGESGSMGRIEPAQLKAMFEGGVISWVQVLALIKGWPLFLFDRNQQPPSGVALQIMEGSLVKQVEDKQAVFSGAWLKAFDMARKLERLSGGEELAGEIDLNWRSAKTSDEKSAMETLQIKFEAGQVPTLQRWRELGYTVDEIDQMIEDAITQDNFGLMAEPAEARQ